MKRLNRQGLDQGAFKVAAQRSIKEAMEVGSGSLFTCPTCGDPDVTQCGCPDPQALMAFLGAFNRAAAEPPPPQPRPGRTRAARRRPDTADTETVSDREDVIDEAAVPGAGVEAGGEPEEGWAGAGWDGEAESAPLPVWPPPEAVLGVPGGSPTEQHLLDPTPTGSQPDGPGSGSDRRRLLRRSRA